MKKLMLLGVAFAIVGTGCGKPTSEGEAKRVREQIARETISANELMEKAENYSGSVLIVTGDMQRYQEAAALADGPMIWIGDSFGKSVPCVFPRSEDSKLKSLKIGETVTVKGKAATILGDAVMKNCTVQ